MLATDGRRMFLFDKCLLVSYFLAVNYTAGCGIAVTADYDRAFCSTGRTLHCCCRYRRLFPCLLLKWCDITCWWCVPTRLTPATGDIPITVITTSLIDYRGYRCHDICDTTDTMIPLFYSLLFGILFYGSCDCCRATIPVILWQPYRPVTRDGYSCSWPIPGNIIVAILTCWLCGDLSAVVILTYSIFCDIPVHRYYHDGWPCHPVPQPVAVVTGHSYYGVFRTNHSPAILPYHHSFHLRPICADDADWQFAIWPFIAGDLTWWPIPTPGPYVTVLLPY